MSNLLVKHIENSYLHFKKKLDIIIRALDKEGHKDTKQFIIMLVQIMFIIVKYKDCDVLSKYSNVVMTGFQLLSEKFLSFLKGMGRRKFDDGKKIHEAVNKKLEQYQVTHSVTIGNKDSKSKGGWSAFYVVSEVSGFLEKLKKTLEE